MTDYVRLSKVMSERGICSRREADRYIEQGLVQVDGAIVSTLGTKVHVDADIVLLPEAQSSQGKKMTILLNKPLGYLSVHAENGYPAARELLTPDGYYGDPKIKSPIVDGLDLLGVAGRLDINSKGLLVFSENGVIIKQIIGPESRMEKEYLVRIAGEVTSDIVQRLCSGLSLDGKKLKRAVVDRLQPQVLRFVLREGKKRQIRRMCELVDLKVTSIKRVRIGKVMLGNLPIGRWRYLRDEESFC